MVKKVVAAAVLVGSLALGSAGVAWAAPGPNCTKVAAVITRLKAEDAQVAAALTSLEASSPHGRHAARRLERAIESLTRVEARLTARITNLEARCPTSVGTGGGTSGAS